MKKKKMILKFITFPMLILMFSLTLINHVSASKIIVGSKNFTENLIVGQIYALALKDRGVDVETKLNLAGTFVAQNALKKGSIDLYPEYTGTGYVDILKHKASHDNKKVYETLNKGYSKWNLKWLKPSTANDSQALVIKTSAAKKYHIKNFSDLSKKAKYLRFASTAEFQGRSDGLPGLKKEYGGFNFKSVSVVDNGVRYKSLLNNKADVTIGFTTDGMLTNKKFTLLKDNKNFYPKYYLTPVVREQALKNNPRVKEILNKVNSKLTTKRLQNMNAKVDVHHVKYQKVAAQFISKYGFSK